MRYKKCLYCGANLDHGERCDCEQKGPPRRSAGGPVINPYDYDSTPRKQMQEQEKRLERQWAKFWAR